MSEIQGRHIREVWDYRLSTATPLIVRENGTWVVQIWAKNNPPLKPGDTPSQPIEVYDTGIPSEKGDQFDTAKVAACYDWLRSVRDKYARPDIEDLKPIVARINADIAELSKRGAV